MTRARLQRNAEFKHANKGEVKMIRASRRYWKITAVSLLMAITAVQCVRIGNAGTLFAPAAGYDEPNIINEVRAIDSFAADLVSYEKRGRDLGSRSSLTQQDFDAIERTGNDLKRRVSDVKYEDEEIINTIKATRRE